MGRAMSLVAPGTGARRPSILLERGAELSTLADCLAAVERSSRGQVLLVGGEAGVGKTTLVRQFCEVNGQSARILWGACDPLSLRRVRSGRSSALLRRLAESSRKSWMAVQPYDVVAALAHELSARAPTIFVLEDLHWADEATLDVFRLLARRIETVPALVIVSYRDDELDPAHPLRIVLGELTTTQNVGRMKLALLSPGAVAQLAEPYGVDADELYRKTAGNPFFVVEALAAGAEGIPETVREAVLARAARLSPTARTVLEAVAVVPPQAELWLLEALAGEAVNGLDECLAAGMLTSESAGVAFRNELARLAVDESVAPHRKVGLHRTALATLSEPPVGALDLARLAHHAEAAGDVDAVLRFAPAAGAEAASLGAHREAAAQYARALRFADRLAPAERAGLLERRSRECYVTDQQDAATAAIEEALECRRELGQRLEEGSALCWLSAILVCPGRNEDSERAAREAVRTPRGPPAGTRARDGLREPGGTMHGPSRRPDEAATWAGRALELAELLGDTDIALDATVTIAVCDPDQHAKLEEALELAREAGIVEHVGRRS